MELFHVHSTDFCLDGRRYVRVALFLFFERTSFVANDISIGWSPDLVLSLVKVGSMHVIRFDGGLSFEKVISDG